MATRNTFNLERKRVNGTWPYILENPEGGFVYLFEIYKHTALSFFDRVESRVGASKVIYSSINKECLDGIVGDYAANIYGKRGDELRPVMLYENEMFINIKKESRAR